MPKKFEKILKNPKKRSKILRYLRKGNINQAINYSEGAMGYKKRTSKKRRARIRGKLKKLRKNTKRKSNKRATREQFGSSSGISLDPISQKFAKKYKKKKGKSKRKSGSPTSIAQNEINKIKDMF